MTRSPLTATLSQLFLVTDTITNTLIFSGAYLGNQYHWQCDLGIIATVVGQFGFIITIAVRIYRVSKVYNEYLRYLKDQRAELSKPIQDHTSEFVMERAYSPMSDENIRKSSAWMLQSGSQSAKFCNTYKLIKTTGTNEE